MLNKNLSTMFVFIIVGFVYFPTSYAKRTEIYPIAILSFKVKDTQLDAYSDKITDLLFASLSTKQNIYLVDRENLNKVFQEAELNLSGFVNQQQAITIGKLTGAKILVTGSMFQIGDDMVLVAKLISTETSRVLGEKVQGKRGGDVTSLVERLAAKLVNKLDNSMESMVAKPVTSKDRLKKLLKKYGHKDRPTVYIDVTEKHLGKPIIDPAAATELSIFLSELGFSVLDLSVADKTKADFILKGEGFSEFAMRQGNLVSVKARLEVKIVDRKTGKILATDRQMEVEIDVAEHIAGKKALQNAAAKIAERVVPVLIKL